MAFLPEAAVEQALLEHLLELGYTIETDERIGPDSLAIVQPVVWKLY